MNSAFSSAFAVKPKPAIHSGVTVFCIPRSSPVAANTTSIAGRPHIDGTRYAPACAATASLAPKSGMTSGVRKDPTTASTAPRPSASHIPSMPTETASP